MRLSALDHVNWMSVLFDAMQDATQEPAGASGGVIPVIMFPFDQLCETRDGRVRRAVIPLGQETCKLFIKGLWFVLCDCVVIWRDLGFIVFVYVYVCRVVVMCVCDSQCGCVLCLRTANILVHRRSTRTASATAV